MPAHRKKLLSLLLAACAATPAWSAVLRVDADAVGAGNGASWANAFPSLQAALAAALPGDQLWIAAGVYKAGPAGNPGLSFLIPDGVSVYGGFAGSESSLAQRNWLVHKTVLSGDIDANDALAADGTTLTVAGSNSAHVLRFGAVGATTLVDGLYVSGGDALAGDGGGVLIEGGQPQLRRLRIVGNRANRGGGIALSGGAPQLSEVIVIDNFAADRGGGLQCDGAAPVASDSIFESNETGAGQGGAVFALNCQGSYTRVKFLQNKSGAGGGAYSGLLSELLIDDSLFDGNLATGGAGGAIRHFNAGAPLLRVRGSEFRANQSLGGGAGLYLVPAIGWQLANELGLGCCGSLDSVNGNGDVRIERSRFRGNHAGEPGGAISTGGNYGVQVTSTLFSGNAAPLGAGIAFLERLVGFGESLQLTNTTFTGNFANAPGALGGALWNGMASTVGISNSVFWNNRDSSGTGTQTASLFNVHKQIEVGGQVLPDMQDTNIRWSMVQGCMPNGAFDTICGDDEGGNLTDTDPGFLAATVPAGAGTLTGDAHLGALSPVINRGNNALLPAGAELDLDGYKRISNAIVDLGAYEQALCPQNRIMHVTTTGAGNRDGSSWANASDSLQTALSMALRAQCHVWVAKGTYKPSNGVDRHASFRLKTLLAVYGGFAGTETSLAQRNWSANPSVLSGELGLASDDADNSLHVVRADNVANTALLDGFTIRKGRANLTSPAQDGYGAGVLMNSSAAILRNLIIEANVADGFGGGLYKTGPGQATIDNVVFQSNSAGSKGGGLHTDNGNLTLRKASFVGNLASQDGGGLSAFSGDVSGSQLRFAGNTAAFYGGGLLYAAQGKLTNVELAGNYAGARGGGVQVQGTLTLTNASITGNRAGTANGGLRHSAGTLLLQNSFVWNNREASVTGSTSANIGAAAGATLRYSMLQGCKPAGSWNSNCGTDGGFNLIDANPLLVAPLNPALAPASGGDHRLQAASPLRNKGDNGALPGDVTTDLAGLPRIVGGVVDHGAHEVQ